MPAPSYPFDSSLRLTQFSEKKSMEVMLVFNMATLDDEQSAVEPWTTGAGVGQINISIIITSGNHSTINFEKDRSSSLVMNVSMVGIFVAKLLSG
jgi:hypothetical protein